MHVTTGRDTGGTSVAESAADIASRTTAIERVLERFGEVALRAGAAHGLRGDDLDEVMQDVRIRIWKSASGLAKLDALTSSYVYRTAASAAVDMLRRRRARREQSTTADPAPVLALAGRRSSYADAALTSTEALAAIGKAVDEIAVNRRAVVRMYLNGYDREEIAALLGWSEAKTRNLLYRGLDDLRQRLTTLGMKP
ncbi:MAG: sigma-70 family RNA polymerase sigma factor [bacterium]